MSDYMVPIQKCKSSAIKHMCICQGDFEGDDPAFDVPRAPVRIELPDTLSRLVNLESILISCHALRPMPSCLQTLETLNSFTLQLKSRSLKYSQSVLESICKLGRLTSLDLHSSKGITSLPREIGNLHELKSLNLSGCTQLYSFPDSMRELKKLTSLDLSKLQFSDVPLFVFFLTQLEELNLSECTNLETLPDWIGNLKKIKQLNLNKCPNIASLPISLSNLTHLSTPLTLLNKFPIPPDIEWEEFKRSVDVPLYIEYMMRHNIGGSILHVVVMHSKRMGELSEVYEWIKRREEGGGEIIKHLCLMLTNGGMRKKEGYGKRIEEWTEEKKKNEGMVLMEYVVSNVYGRERRKVEKNKIMETGRRMKSLWVLGGKDKEGRREWKRRWRESVDIMSEEDVMETCIMHLYIAEEKKKEKLIVPSECSLHALSTLFCEESQTQHSGHHFPVYDANREAPNVVIIRNLPLTITPSIKAELETVIRSVCEYFSFSNLNNIQDANNKTLRLILHTSSDAKLLVDRMNGYTLSMRTDQLTLTHGSALTLSFLLQFPLMKNKSSTETESKQAFGFRWYESNIPLYITFLNCFILFSSRLMFLLLLSL